MCTEAHIIGDIWSNVADEQSPSLGRGFWNRRFQNVGTAKIDLKTIQLSQPTSKPRSNWMIVVFRGGGPTSKDITVKSSAHLKLKFLIDFCCLLLYYVTVKSTMLLLGFYNQQPLSGGEARAGNHQTSLAEHASQNLFLADFESILLWISCFGIFLIVLDYFLCIWWSQCGYFGWSWLVVCC